jgi:alkaline phosphatase
MTSSLDRRSFLGVSAATAALLAAGAPLARAQKGNTGRPARGAARNLIFLVSDGMSIGTFQLAERVRELHQGRTSNWARLINTEGAHTTFAFTRSANSEVTDSAAASSAWSVGVPVNSGSICVLPDGRPGEPILLRARRSGRATGLVTTTRLTHATPAAFATVAKSRNLEGDIAQQLIDNRIDLLLGGGAKHFPKTLLDSAGPATFLRSAVDLASLGRAQPGDRRLIGLFADDHMAYEVDRKRTDEPSLADMSRAAIRHLSSMPGQGFALQIEAARVDHAAHICDPAGILHDQLAFDDAVQVALDFALARTDTLVIVTTDHGNAAPSLTIGGRSRLDSIVNANASFDTLFARIKEAERENNRIPEHVHELVREATGVTLKSTELAILMRSFSDEAVNPFEDLRNPANVLGSLLANHNGVAFASGSHTAEPVLVTAIGPGSAAIPALGHLTDTHHAVAAAMDLPEPALL